MEKTLIFKTIFSLTYTLKKRTIYYTTKSLAIYLMIVFCVVKFVFIYALNNSNIFFRNIKMHFISST
jgi:hypothetical protein